MAEPIQLIQPQFGGSALQRSQTYSGHVTFIFAGHQNKQPLLKNTRHGTSMNMPLRAA